MKAVFVDTMGWFSLLNSRDAFHESARAAMDRLRKGRVPLVTSDYVADETATLLKMRGAGHVLERFLTTLDESEALTFTFIDLERFRQARRMFLTQRDHGYSFTDVTSFIVMRELGLRRAFTHDRHFREAGFDVLL
jgi:uncharacterized protein